MVHVCTGRKQCLHKINSCFPLSLFYVRQTLLGKKIDPCLTWDMLQKIRVHKHRRTRNSPTSTDDDSVQEVCETDCMPHYHSMLVHDHDAVANCVHTCWTARGVHGRIGQGDLLPLVQNHATGAEILNPEWFPIIHKSICGEQIRHAPTMLCRTKISWLFSEGNCHVETRLHCRRAKS